MNYQQNWVAESKAFIEKFTSESCKHCSRKAITKCLEAYGWQVIRNVDGHDAEQIRAATILAQAEKEKPTLIICKPSLASVHQINQALMIATVRH